jgi:hypothetical protein
MLKLLKSKHLAGAFLVILLIASILGSQSVFVFTARADTVTLTWSTHGAYSWTAPGGVTTAIVETWGAGAGGWDNNPLWGSSAAGAGAGAYSKSTLTVTPGVSYDIVVGLAGAHAHGYNNPSQDGGDSYFNTSTTVMAKGGKGYMNDNTGAGGLASQGYGDTKYSGGSGAGEISGGGGGGGAAGSTGNGNDGSGNTGGSGNDGGGKGGDGGNSGVSPGGGAGGGYNNGSAGADGQVKITYTLCTYSVAYSAGSHGSLSGNTSQTVSCGGNGTAVTAIPDSCYHFTQWNDASTQNPRQDDNVSGNISVTASFALTYYSLTYSAGSHGSLTGNISQSVPCGGNGTAVTAIPDSCYHFTQWSDASMQNPRQDDNASGNINVTATFAIDVYSLTYSPGAHGSLSGNISQIVNCGGNGTAVTAIPDSCYHFTEWSDSYTVNPRQDNHIIGNLTFTALFAINTYSLSYETAGYGYIDGDTSQTVSCGGNGTAVTPIADWGFTFSHWSDLLEVNPRQDNNITMDETYTAYFVGDPVVLTVSVIGNGTTSPAPGEYATLMGTVVDLAAIPGMGYDFSAWSGDVDNYLNPDTFITMTGNETVTATFTATPPITAKDLMLMCFTLIVSIGLALAGAYFPFFFLPASVAWILLGAEFTKAWSSWFILCVMIGIIMIALFFLTVLGVFKGKRKMR